MHANEYALLQAGRRVASALAVPLYDRCGAPGSLSARGPDGVIIEAAGAVPPAPTTSERVTAAGVELSFQVRRGGAIALTSAGQLPASPEDAPALAGALRRALGLAGGAPVSTPPDQG
jgi:hypothetical protein